jgi:hypothetical protein
MIVKFELGKVIITELIPYCISDPIDDIMFFLMIYGVDDHLNRYFKKGVELFEYNELTLADEIWMCFNPAIRLSRKNRKFIVNDILNLI